MTDIKLDNKNGCTTKNSIIELVNLTGSRARVNIGFEAGDAF